MIVLNRKEIIEVAKEHYEMYDNNKKIFTIKRNSDLMWEARDTEDNKIDKPDMYRNDLFERLAYRH